jgi:NAD(P)-dependent dehydrogenase (short-subunit alcohol dehydrogenase family)
LPDRPVLVVTGGARGVTARCLLALCGALKPRLAVFGRSEPTEIPDALMALDEVGLKRALLGAAKTGGKQYLPRELSLEVARIMATREAQHNTRLLRQAGAEVQYFPVDVADPAAVSLAVNEVRQRWGNIDGLIHGAGLTADKYIVEKTEAQFASVFNTKVTGLRALLDATRDDRLSLLVLFSSVAARYGNVGQSDYAMANEVLNKVARIEAAARPNCFVRAINWGPWDSGMVTPTLQRLFRERGVTIIESDVGAAAFVNELKFGLSGPDEVEVILGASLLADEGRSANVKSRSPEVV